MAGGFNSSQHSKKPIKNFGSEVLKDSQYSSPSEKSATKFSLRGILGLGQTVEINQKHSSTEKQTTEFLYGLNHLVTEQNVLFDHHQKELTSELKALREEITKLINSSDNLEKDVAKIALTEIPEVSEYQINFLSRIRIFIANVVKNISSADLWVEAFAAKKRKRNMFWNNVKNKKKGGEQYLFSNEHSAARSAN